MTRATDWGPAREVAKKFFPKIGPPQNARYFSFEDSPPLWDGETVHASSPANLLHEVAHFQLAPEWRRHVHGYGLGREPEGGLKRSAPLLVNSARCYKEESLASALGIWWEIYLGYENWAETAGEHSWLRYECDANGLFVGLRNPRDPVEFLRLTGPVTRKLRQLGLLGPYLTPQPVLAPSWRHSSFKHAN